MPFFRKKPVVIEARLYDGSPESNRDIIDWTQGSETPATIESQLSIATLEGAHWVDKGDYVIRGIKGEFYPCKPDIFDKTYEPVDGDWETV